MLDLSVVIPTLNAQASLARAIEPVQGQVREIIVSDGGSVDGTVEVARSLGATVVSGSPGRGGQLKRGALAAKSAWLMFLHADTDLDAGWREFAADMMSQSDDATGYFRFALDDCDPQARRLESWVAWRARTFGLPYGDQGLLISRKHYDQTGGYNDIPLMEDVDLVRRIGRAKLKALTARAVTSAARFKRDGYWRRSTRNLICLGLYFAGVSPASIKRIYG